METSAVLVEQSTLDKTAFQPKFNDQDWDDVLSFIRRYLQSEERILLPDEFCDILVNDAYSVYSYHQISEEKDQFHWILLHKGRLEHLPLDFLEKTWSSSVPVFANHVFVLFSRFRRTSVVHHQSAHIHAFWVALLKLRRKQLLSRLRNVISSLKYQMIDRNYLGNSIEHRSFKEHHILRHKMSAVPLSWVATSREQSFANLGDALSPIIVSALSGLPVVHRDFSSWRTRLASVGTIAHGLRCGTVHLWGTGIDHRKHPADPKLDFYEKPPNTKFHIHALRGPFSAQTFRKQGLDVPDIYGDPIWFLPSIVDPAKKQYELGVIVHLSELDGLSDTAQVNKAILRYKIPPSLASSVKIITTMTQPTWGALEAKVKEITACKRIASTSLHGLVIAEAYGIPCVYFRLLGKKVAFPNLDDDGERLDWRMRDFYKGVGLQNLFVYGQRRVKATDWEDLIRAIDLYWNPIHWSAEAFLDAFPLPLAFNPLKEKYTGDRTRLEQIKL